MGARFSVAQSADARRAWKGRNLCGPQNQGGIRADFMEEGPAVALKEVHRVEVKV